MLKAYLNPLQLKTSFFHLCFGNYSCNSTTMFHTIAALMPFYCTVLPLCFEAIFKIYDFLSAFFVPPPFLKKKKNSHITFKRISILISSTIRNCCVEQGGQQTWNFWNPGKVREFCDS